MSIAIVKDCNDNTATATQNNQLCIYFAERGQAQGDLFDTSRKPWCDPNSSNNEETLDIVTRCSTDSLSIVFSDGTDGGTNTSAYTVTVVYRGPFHLQGDLNINDAPEDEPDLKFRVSLYHCGLSINKPYCDNSYVNSDFKDSDAVGDKGSPLAEIGVPFKVALMEYEPKKRAAMFELLPVAGDQHSKEQKHRYVDAN